MTKLPTNGRSVEEWRGSSPDAKVPTKVRLRIFERAGGRCHLSGRKIAAGDVWELEHIRPLSMGGEHVESNLAPALATFHRMKTASEATERAKADRIRARHLGLRPESRRKIPSRPFPKSRGEARFDD